MAKWWAFTGAVASRHSLSQKTYYHLADSITLTTNGLIGIISIGAIVSAAAFKYTTIATLPEDMRPAYAARGAGMGNTANDQYPVILSVDTAGNVNINPAARTINNERVYGQVTFLIV